MNKVLNTRPPGWFWIASIGLLIWNLESVLTLVSHARIGLESIFGFAEDERLILNAMPMLVWATLVIATFAGLLGIVGLLRRKSWAIVFLVAALFAIAIQYFWSLVAGYLPGTASMWQILVAATAIAICIFQVWLANRGIRRGWLR